MGNAKHSSGLAAKIVLIDDDFVFRSLMLATAKSMRMDLTAFSSIAEMGSFARLRQFDLALIDYKLEHLNGFEIAEYIDTFFADLPVILVTGSDVAKLMSGGKSPQSVRTILSKKLTAKEILERVQMQIDRRDILKHFSSRRAVASELPYVQVCDEIV